VVARAIRGIQKDVLIVREDRPLAGGRYLVCVDGSAYSYKAMRVALELAREFEAKLYVASAFDVEYHHVVFHNIKDVLSVQASKVFKFEEQEELHNNIIDKGLLRLCQANLKRAEVMAGEYPDVEIETQILIGKPFQVVLQWAAEVEPSLLVVARHGSHRIEGTDLGSQADNLTRIAAVNTLLVGTTEVHPEEIPWIEEDGETGLEWTPDAEVRILRVPPFALGIARKAVEEFVLERYGVHGEAPGNGDGSTGHAGADGNGGSHVEGDGNGNGSLRSLPTVTGDRLDEAIQKLLPTHMQLIMGIGTAEELALAEIKAEEALKRTVVEGLDADPAPAVRMVEAKCPYTGHAQQREWTEKDAVVWTGEAFQRLSLVPLIARPLARNTVERFAREHSMWRITTAVMDENKQAMIEADEFDLDTMLVMFKELQTKQLKAAAEGVDGLTPEMRKFIEEAKAAGVTRCPIRDIEKQMVQCPVDFKAATPAEAKAAVEAFLRDGDGAGEDAPKA
jgi:nucleotide-binding universal stress UspA family protein